MKPGATTSPTASISVLPRRRDVEIAAILRPAMATSRTASSPDSGSITRPPCNTKSYGCAARAAEKRHAARRDFIQAGMAGISIACRTTADAKLAPMYRAISLLLIAAAARAQSPAELMNDPRVRAAMEAAQRNEPQTIDLQIRVCEIPAPPFQEEQRGKELKRLFEELRLKNVRVDKAGNVIGERPGKSPRPNLVFAAHLDTVFPQETNVKVTRNGTMLKGPGIGDDCRGLAVMLAVIRALDE